MNHRKKINPLKLAKFHAIIFAIIGLLCGFVYSFGGLIIDVLVSLNWYNTVETPGLSYGTVLAFGALIGMPLLFAICGYIFGVIEALVFNLVPKYIGNMPINFENKT